MKKSQLRQIIKEEISKVLDEGVFDYLQLPRFKNNPGVVLFPGEGEDYIGKLHDLEEYIRSKGKEWGDYEPILKGLGVNTYDFSSWLDYAHEEEMEEVINALYKYAKTL